MIPSVHPGGCGGGTNRCRRLVGALAGLGAIVSLVSACGRDADTYGALPTFLPTSSLRPDAILTGSETNPAVTSQGDAVEVHIGSGIGAATVRAIVTGPTVPGEGLPRQTEATTCTWTITLSGASAEIPLDVEDFTSIDHLGTVYHPTVVAEQTAPPARLVPGATTTFTIRAVMRVGEGLMRWAPGGRGALASWDFEVEND